MALKDSFINLNKALRTTLQNVPAVVDTLIRGFDEIGDAAEEQTTYSTDERIVGKWIDGSEIIEKTFNINLEINAGSWGTTTIDNTNGEIKIILHAEGFNSGSGAYWGFLAVNPNIGHEVEVLNIRSSAITVSYLTLRYIKRAASRSPEENDTKNGGEDKPDVKTVEEPAEELKK